MTKLTTALYFIPPIFAVFGYGGIVCFHKTGALSRIRRSFIEVTK